MLNQYFNDERIINQLCKERVKGAGATHDRQYIPQLIGQRTEAAAYNPFDQYLPPRREWSAFRPRQRTGGLNPDLFALKKAVRILRVQQPERDWVIALNRYIVAIRERVLNSRDFAFTAPTISWELKKKGEYEYRALCRFNPDDNLILCLYAQYLRDMFDPQFSGSSYAFRAARNGKIPTHHDAFNEVYNIRRNSGSQNVYVAECDIEGFFDTVDHRVALDIFHQAAQHLNLHPRAELIFRAYLDCYSFPVNVLANAEPRLKQRDSAGFFKWPAPELRKLHNIDPRGLRIGVPQGGAISGIIANLIMDAADKCVESERERLGADIHYYRFCDDMLLISPNPTHCQTVFKAYLEKLTELKLVFHKPEKTYIYGKKHWLNKSKAPYCWSGQKWFGSVPWVQFVGYQIRYDGLVRPRKDSVRKQSEKLVKTANDLKFGLALANRIRATKQQVLASLKAKLTAQGVGRVKGGEVAPLPMCWASGYRALHEKPFVPGALRSFDRTRQKQIRRLGNAAIQYGPGRVSRGSGNRRSPVGYAFSYHAQFTNLDGQNLIQNPWRPGNHDDVVKSFIFILVTGRLFKTWIHSLKQLLNRSTE